MQSQGRRGMGTAAPPVLIRKVGPLGADTFGYGENPPSGSARRRQSSLGDQEKMSVGRNRTAALTSGNLSVMGEPLMWVNPALHAAMSIGLVEIA